MRVLVLGYSSIVQRRVLPALRSLPGLEIHLASRRAEALRTTLLAAGVHRVHQVQAMQAAKSPNLHEQNAQMSPMGQMSQMSQTGQTGQTGQMGQHGHGNPSDHGDYLAAMDAAQAQVVYVSLPNALHAGAVRAALQRGAHVLVDKPAVLSLHDAQGCVTLAAREGVLLAEATVWDRHPVWTRLAELQRDVDCTWRHLSATFAFPHFAADNFRNASALGGGALNDLGPYAASCVRRFIGPVDQINAIALTHDRSAGGVDLAFGVLAGGGGCAFTGQFGFGAAYTNRLELVGDTARFCVEPAFTTAANAAVVLRWRHRDIEHATPVDAADSFALFIAQALADAQGDKARHAPWARALLDDARFMHQLRQAHQTTLAGAVPLDRAQAAAASHRPPWSPEPIYAGGGAPTLPRTLAEAIGIAATARAQAGPDVNRGANKDATKDADKDTDKDTRKAAP